MRVEAYEPSAADEWDELVSGAPMATFLHTRAFLGYHGERFSDVSALVRDPAGQLVGVLPAAADPRDAASVLSHPGATYGGLVHDGSLRGQASIDALAGLVEHYRALGFERLSYAVVPFIYHRRPSADDLYALFRLGAVRSRCDLACAVDLADGPELSSRRRRRLAKARRGDVEVLEGSELLDSLWPLVERNLAERHGARPTHSLVEMRTLVGMFPDEIALVLARFHGEPVAGVVLFDSPRVSHAQYIASLPAGNDSGALEAVFEYCLARAARRAQRFFDFGTSNRDDGRVLNEGLYTFKTEFGGGGVAYDRYELDLIR